MNFLTYLWHKIFPVKVDDILGDLQKTINKLENAVLHHQDQAIAKADAATVLTDQSANHSVEAGRASAVAANLNNLINPNTGATNA